MNPGTIVTAEVNCAQCAHPLRLLPADGVCPNCRFPIPSSLQTTLMATGNRHLRRISRGLFLSAWLTIGLGVGCITNPLTMLITGWYGPLGILFLFTVCLYAWLQLAATLRTASPDSGRRSPLRILIALGGATFAVATTAALFSFTAAVFSFSAPWPVRSGILTKAALFGLPFLLVFTSALYKTLCVRTGKRSLLALCRLGEFIGGIGALTAAFAYWLLPLAPSGMPLLSWQSPASWFLLAGAVALIASMIPTVILQLYLSHHLSALAETLGDRTVLTGLPSD